MTFSLPRSPARSAVFSSVLVIGMAAALVGCSSASGGGRGDCTPASSGSGSEAIDVTGDTGSAPEVDFANPLTTTETQRSLVDTGEGDVVATTGSTVTASIYAYNATDGKAVAQLTAENQALELGDQLLPTLNEALDCAVSGDRIAALLPPIDGIDSGGTDVGLTSTDSIVIIFDVTDVSAAAAPSPSVSALPKADGADQPATAGFPTVTLADDGAPTITMPTTPAPTDLQIAVLKKGDGATVEDGANVTVHYTGAIYATGAVFDSSWTRGAPATFPTSGVIAGFSKALVGQTVGSQVIAVIPPAEGYGDTPPEGSGISATDTLVFVVDILATQ